MGSGPHDEDARSPLPDPGDAPAGTRAAGWPVAEAKSRNARFRILSESAVITVPSRPSCYMNLVLTVDVAISSRTLVFSPLL